MIPLYTKYASAAEKSMRCQRWAPVAAPSLSTAPVVVWLLHQPLWLWMEACDGHEELQWDMKSQPVCVAFGLLHHGAPDFRCLFSEAGLTHRCLCKQQVFKHTHTHAFLSETRGVVTGKGREGQLVWPSRKARRMSSFVSPSMAVKTESLHHVWTFKIAPTFKEYEAVLNVSFFRFFFCSGCFCLFVTSSW